VTTFEWGMKKWAEGTPVAGTLAETYLKSRGISLAPPDCLRFHPAVRHAPTKQDLPALLALATDIRTGAPLAVQCTYLARDGKAKANVEKKDQRRTFGSPKGGVVKLAEPADGMPLLLGEGVETTATAIEATGYPGWATLGTSGLVNIELPNSVQEVIPLAENDESGANQKALDKICPGLIERGIRVRIAGPPAGVNDFNDLVKPEGNVGSHTGLVIVKMTINAAQEWEPRRGRAPKPQAPKQVSQASFLVDLVISRCELFCDRHGEPHACFLARHSGGEHRETHKLRSVGFSHWLRLAYYEEKNGAPSSEAMSTANKTLMAKARYGGLRRDIFLRTAALDGKVYVDLADDQWRAIEIDSDGYRVVDDPPVHFRRGGGMLSLPAPSNIDPRNGIEKLRELLRLRDARDFVIIVAWLLAALASRGPFAVIIFLGEPGATKSSTAYAVRSIVDPNASALRLKPREPRDVFIAANHGLIVAYNNLSNIPEWLSDTLCVVSEGSGESRRELYSDADESLLYARAPFLLTGIENVVVRSDLAQRTLFVHLASVPNSERLTEDDFKTKFKRAHADILGALCGAVSVGLRREKTLKLPALPRMASFFH
jgi:Toprim domain